MTKSVTEVVDKVLVQRVQATRAAASYAAWLTCPQVSDGSICGLLATYGTLLIVYVRSHGYLYAVEQSGRCGGGILWEDRSAPVVPPYRDFKGVVVAGVAYARDES